MERGGKREGAGRKPKSEELKLIEKLTPYEDTAIMVLIEKIESKDMQAVKLFFEYLYGKPKQQIEQRNEHSFDTFDIKEFFKIGNNK